MGREDVEEVERILSVVSSKVPDLIKGIIASVFSESTGREIGKAVGAFYKSLIESGIPEQTALKMAENYLSTFTNFGEIMKRIGAGEERRREQRKEEPKEG
ncbi:MAG: hypothetical protein QW702_06895 [Candidatus Bathyarchaeia archaeon]